jgi:hypothetical protein
MRWAARIGFPILFVLMVYTAWPFVDLYRLAKAAEARNAAAVAERVDFRRLRMSIADQVVAAYQAMRGREAGPVGRTVVATLGEPLGEALVGSLISAESMVVLLSQGWPEHVLPTKPADAVSLTPNWSRLLDLYINSEYTVRDFSIWLPVTRPLQERYRLRLQLISWRWRLVGIDLPERVRVALAEELGRLLAKR